MSTLVLLPALLPMLTDPDPWGGCVGLRVTLDAEPRPPYLAQWVARVAQRVRAAVPPTEPLLLVATGPAGALLPALGAALRSSRHRVTGYGFVDALLPRTGASLAELGAPGVDLAAQERTTGPADWPDAPCAYVLTDPDRETQARIADLRAWAVRRLPGDPFTVAVAALRAELAPGEA